MSSTIPLARLAIVQKNKPTVPAMHSNIAEEIMNNEGMAYAIAIDAGSQEDIAITRDNLKIAIARAMATEFTRRTTAAAQRS